jgi:hypothetical protein
MAPESAAWECLIRPMKVDRSVIDTKVDVEGKVVGTEIYEYVGHFVALREVLTGISNPSTCERFVRQDAMTITISAAKRHATGSGHSRPIQSFANRS